ncbi:MAG TPA: glycosyltransferase [Pirellulales bacterium]|nr:glycosyltransferase [Pirellulales bacterium]
MNTKKLVSVVMPVFNGQAFLAQAVESVLAQTYQPIELIAVDDGSTDASADILAGFGSRIRVIRQPNAGVSAARNAGIEQARGELIAFLDQDDWWQPEKVARQVELFQTDDRIGLVHTAVACYDEALQREVGPQDPTARPEDMVGDCHESLLLGNPLVNSSAIVRRSALDGVGGLDLQIRGNTVQDYDLWLRMARRYRFAYLPDRLTVFRLHGKQGHRDRRAMLGDELALLLRERRENEWRVSSAGRRRLADLHDSLATAHFEAGDASEARRHFRTAMRIEPSRRRVGRFGASCLPYAAVSRMRRAWHWMKATPSPQFQAATVSTRPHPSPLPEGEGIAERHGVRSLQT